MTQTIPSSPINTRARSNFAARYVEHYLNRCCLECLVAEQEVRIEGTRVNTQVNRYQPCDPISWNHTLMLAKWFNDGHRRFLFYYCCCYAIGNEISSRVVKKLRVSARFYFTYFFFSFLFFLHFTCCNFISFEDKSFHYGSRCFVTFVLVPSYIRMDTISYTTLWELFRGSTISFVIFIADIYQGICLEQNIKLRKEY